MGLSWAFTDPEVERTAQIRLLHQSDDPDHVHQRPGVGVHVPTDRLTGGTVYVGQPVQACHGEDPVDGAMPSRAAC